MQAMHWSYLYNGDPELVTSTGKKYSTDIWNCYEPMCISCHRQWDRQMEPERYAFQYAHKPYLVALNEQEVVEIKELYDTGRYTQIEIAGMYKVAQNTVSRAIRNVEAYSTQSPG
jgi:hypothetical protein